MTDPVQSFRLDLTHLCHVTSRPKTGRDSFGQRPDLLDQFGDCEANDFEYAHKMFRRQMTVRVLRV